MAILFADDCFFDHDTGSHPESAGRLRAIYRQIKQSGLERRFRKGTVVPATPEQLTRVHTPEYVAAIEDFASKGGGRIDADTVVCPHSYDVALRAAGSAIASVDSVVSGANRRAVCLCRPPGHHALPERAMGFCLFNNIAVAARHAVDVHELSRVLIVDWDVHHGNGTQDIFYRSAEVSFFSAHRFPFYPGTGSEDETGSGPGSGTTFNLPLSMGISQEDYHLQFRRMLETAARQTNPELVLISAGFDAHRDDPIGSLGLASHDFALLTEAVIDVADEFCDGRIVSVLEGGYNESALAESVALHLDALVPAEGDSD